MGWVAVSLGLILATSSFATQPPRADRTGAVIFATLCSTCHLESNPQALRAPFADELRRLRREDITRALTDGVMMEIGNGLTDAEIDRVADFLTTTSPASADPSKTK